MLLLLGLTTAGLGGSAAAIEPDEVPEALSVAPARGPATGGHTVTVTGSLFEVGDTGVRFGPDHYVEATVLSPTRLTFVAPPHPPGSVTLTVVVSEVMSVGTLEYVIESPTPTATPTPSVTPGEITAGDVPPAVDLPQRKAPEDGDRPDRPRAVPGDPTAAVPPRLAETGASTVRTAALAVLVILAGVVLVRIGRAGERPERLDRDGAERPTPRYWR